MATLSYVTNVSDATDSTTYTFSGTSIGTADPDRTVIVAVAIRNVTAPAFTSVTIAGSAATLLFQSAVTGNRLGVFALPVPSGTTADIVVNLDATALRCGISVYEATGITTLPDYALAGQNSVMVPFRPGSVALGVAINGAPGDISWQNLTEDTDLVIESQVQFSTASRTGDKIERLSCNAVIGGTLSDNIEMFLAWFPKSSVINFIDNDIPDTVYLETLPKWTVYSDPAPNARPRSDQHDHTVGVVQVMDMDNGVGGSSPIGYAWAVHSDSLGSPNQTVQSYVWPDGKSTNDSVGVMARQSVGTISAATDIDCYIGVVEVLAELSSFEAKLFRVTNGTGAATAIATSAGAVGPAWTSSTKDFGVRLVVSGTGATVNCKVYVQDTNGGPWTLAIDYDDTDASRITSGDYAGRFWRRSSTGDATGQVFSRDWLAAGSTDIQLDGGIVSQPGDGYVYHTFYESGAISPVPNVDSVDVEYLAVAGGGGATGFTAGGCGGGGAGGMLTGAALTISSAQTITIGAGGSAGTIYSGVPAGSEIPTSGSGSSIGALVSTTGGGRGGYSLWNGTATAGADGGSGGGGGSENTPGAGGAATSGQGSAGGAGIAAGNALNRGSGGGGGKAAVGGAGSFDAGGNGGDGAEWPTGSGTYYAGGGGGSDFGTGAVGGTGGLGGGGTAGVNDDGLVESGAPNTGGGGGASSGTDGSHSAGAGGSGIVIIRYEITATGGYALTATRASDTQIDLAWTAWTAPAGYTLVGYQVERDGTVIAEVGVATSYNDTSVAVNTVYDYRIRAVLRS